MSPVIDRKNVMSTGNPEFDKKLGGGLPLDSLSLVEGEPDSGKSVFSQQVTWGSLRTGFRVTILTTENTVASFVRQMESLSLDIRDYLLLGRLKVYPVKAMKAKDGARESLRALTTALTKQQDGKIVIIDSLTSFIAHSSVEDVISFFEECKSFCEGGLTIILIAHKHVFLESTLVRIGSMCDAHLRLSTVTVGDKIAKTLEVSKIRGAHSTTGNVISFDVEPSFGMRIIPLSKAKA